MSETEFRSEFFAEARRDPYLHAITHSVGEVWAYAYEQALRDAIETLQRSDVPSEVAEGVLSAMLDEKRFDERFNEGIRWLTEDRRDAHARALVAFAELGRRADRRPLLAASRLA